MTLTNDLPLLPPELALPGRDEPLSDYDVHEASEAAQRLADECAIDVSAALDQLRSDDEGDGSASEHLRSTLRWRVTDDPDAEWAMRKLAAVERERDDVREQAQLWRDEISRWERERCRPLDARAAFFEGALIDYLRELRDADPAVKSRKLPSGTISSRSSGAKVVIADADAVIAWAEATLDGDDLAAVVRKAAQLSEFRKVASVEQREHARRYVLVLSCGHSADVTVPLDSHDVELPSCGDAYSCPACDPEYGEQPTQTVVESSVETLTRAVVCDNDSGEPIPGADVAAPSVSYAVKVTG